MKTKASIQCIIGIFLLFLVAQTATAQETAANINGRITDEDGPLPGATVRAVHEPSGTEYGTTARSDGRYNLRNVRVGGPYTITVSFVGYQEAEEEDINLELGQNYTANFQLVDDEAELDELVIFGQRDAVISSDRSGSSSRVSRAQIDAMPSIDRSLQDYTRLTPQVSGDNIAGRSGRRNEIQIDGVTFSDRFGLGSDAIPTIGNPISLDAIDEFQVNISPYDVQQGNFTGGSVNAVTRSGTNTYEGSGYFYGRNQGFISEQHGNLDEPSPVDDFYEYQTGFRIGGPIIENELFFFANLETKQETSPIEVGLTGDDGDIFNVAPSTMDQIISISEDQYGYDPGGYGTLNQDTDDIKFFAKLDYNLSSDHQLTFQQNIVQGYDDRGISRGAGSFSFANRQYRQRGNQANTSLQLNSQFGDNLNTEAKIAYTRLRQEADYGDAPFPSVQINFEDEGGNNVSTNHGVERFRHVNQLNQDYLEFTGNLTYFTGDHILTFGTNNYVNFIENVFLQDFLGTYTFDSIEDYQMGSPSRYQYTYPTDQAESNEPAADWRYNFFSLYAQDEWSATENLTLTLGARADFTVFPEEPLSNETFASQFDYDTGEVPDVITQINPRFGFNWNDGDWQIRGGAGMFSGGEPAVWLSNQYSNTGVDLARVDSRDVNFEGFFSPDPDNQPRPGDGSGLDPIETTEVNVTDPDFKINQVFRTNLAVERRLPGNFFASVEGIFTNNIQDIDYQNLNLNTDDPEFMGATDGRAFYSGDNVSEDFTNILLLTNTTEGYQYSVTGQLRREFTDNWYTDLSYTFSDGFAVNDGTSSRAISNWQFNDVQGNPNAADVGRTIHTTRHRVLGIASYRFDFGQRFATTLSVIYEGRSGAPFSYIYNTSPNAPFSVNGDFRGSNDLMYIPENANEVEMSDADWAAFDDYIEDREELRENRGSIVDRNTGFAPWVNEFDLRVTQQVGLVGSQYLEFTLDILNVGNLLNNDWGVTEFAPNGEVAPVTFEGFTDDNRQQLSFRDVDEFVTDNISSRWRMQFGVRYSF